MVTMAPPPFEVADVIRLFGEDYLRLYGASTTPQQRQVLAAIQACRTAALGGHLDVCDHCGHEVPSYNSCRNRHCPKCQASASAVWLQERASQLLPVPYFHVVFTLPDLLRPLVLQNKRLLYGLLFDAASQTLTRIAADPKHLGAQLGFLGVLHTWSQTLLDHPHVHFVVTGGGLSPDRSQWIPSAPEYLLPVQVLSALFRGVFLALLERHYVKGDLRLHGRLETLRDPPAFHRLLRKLRSKSWVVYAKKPWAGPEHVLRYLARYTHRIAITNHRIHAINNGRVTFWWKDYANKNRKRLMTVTGVEFIRRFLLHVLPRGFVRIRHYGLLANRHREENLRLCRRLLNRSASAAPDPQDADQATPPPADAASASASPEPERPCPACGLGHLRRGRELRPGAVHCPPTTVPRAPRDTS